MNTDNSEKEYDENDTLKHADAGKGIWKMTNKKRKHLDNYIYEKQKYATECSKKQIVGDYQLKKKIW